MNEWMHIADSGVLSVEMHFMCKYNILILNIVIAGGCETERADSLFMYTRDKFCYFVLFNESISGIRTSNKTPPTADHTIDWHPIKQSSSASSRGNIAATTTKKKECFLAMISPPYSFTPSTHNKSICVHHTSPV